MPLEVSIVKHGYNPYFPQNHPYQHPVSNPQIRIQNEQPLNMSVPQMPYNSRMHNNSRIAQYPAQNRMSNMNQVNHHKTNQTTQPTRPTLLRQPNKSFQANNAPMIQITPPNRRPASRSNDRHPHLHQSEQTLTPSSSQRILKSNFSYSSPPSRDMTNSWSGQRKGINLMSPPPRML